MVRASPHLRLFVPTEIEILRAIEKAARARYAALPDFAFASNGNPIAVDRFSAGLTVVSDVSDRQAGFALLQPLDGLLYLANISVLPECGNAGVGTALLDAALAVARGCGAPAIALTTFKLPLWNGPWFRKHGYIAMPRDEMGSGLRAILDRHATFLDITTRETLWKPL